MVTHQTNISVLSTKIIVVKADIRLALDEACAVHVKAIKSLLGFPISRGGFTQQSIDSLTPLRVRVSYRHGV